MNARRNPTPAARPVHSKKTGYLHVPSAKNQRPATVPLAPDAHFLSLDIVREAQQNYHMSQQIRMLLNEPEWRTQVEKMGMGAVYPWSQRDSLIVVKDIIHKKTLRELTDQCSEKRVLVPQTLRETFLH